MRIIGIAVVLAAFSLGACATDEWYQAKNECDYQGMIKHPSEYQRQLVTRTRQSEVPTGAYTCVTQKRKDRDITTCQPQTRTVYEDYQVMEDVDIHQAIRERYVSDCTSKLCVQRYGNADCEASHKKTTAP